MSKLTQIHKKILANLNDYLSDKKKIELLAANIELFEEISVSYLNKLFKELSVFDFGKNNHALLIIAASYLHYACENKENKSLNDLIILLNKANNCLQRVLDSYSMLPPTQLNDEHAEHLLIANFQLHKVKFLKAEIRLFFIEKEVKNDLQNTTLIRKNLIHIIDECVHFQGILEQQYKDSLLREKLLINNELLHSIQEKLAQAKNLLDELPQQQTSKRHLSATLLDDKFATRENIEDTSKIKRKKPNVKTKSKSSAASSTQSQQINSDDGSITSRWNDLVTLSTAAAEVTPMVTHDEHVSILPSMPHPVTAPQIFWSQPTLPQSAEDSNKFLTELKKWANVYFDIKHYYSEDKKARKSLEKIAHSLLLAAVTLQQESSVFKGQQFNPVIQTAVQLLLFISGKGVQSTTEAIETLNELSKSYAPLLKPFIRTFIHVAPEKLISHLRMQFASKGPSNISFLDLETQEIVEQLFKHFETLLTADDYEKVTKCCLDCLIKAHDKLIEQNAAQPLYSSWLN